ncbi:UPF0545 protein C22orf39 homolog [Aplysia californica]|uniref:Synaptic plasticity regulator PANTS n=1 Tax=Aplysia californica TaxID=6500 RepID=A0ABM0K795_APLCA|nr:UPF0545 protein C22orf39 homolog [Aplysia californica]
MADKQGYQAEAMGSKTQTAANLPDGIWLMRPCEVYKEEHRDCKSFLSRLYQYYIDGSWSDCSQWLTDYNNCMRFRKSKDMEALESLIASERQRRKERIQNAKANDVWEYRTSPPPEWSAPLDSQDSREGSR